MFIRHEANNKKNAEKAETYKAKQEEIILEANVDDEKVNSNEGELKAKSCKVSIAEGSAYSVMDGFGLRYITPYAVAMSMPNSLIGALSSLPSLIGSFFQIKGSREIERYPRKKIVIWSVFLQTLMWLPLILTGILYFYFGLSVILSSVLLIIFYTALITFGAFAGPAWSSWMKDIVPKDNTDGYFGKRSGIAGTAALISMFIAGGILALFQGRNIIIGFVIIFSLACAGRGLSIYLFTKKYEPKMAPLGDNYYFTLGQFIKKMPKNNFGKFVIFSTLISFSTAIASPFFAVYMLKDLHLNYAFYTMIVIGSAISTLIFMPLWGKFGDKYGNVEVLKICGAFIFIVPILWMFTPFFSESSLLLISYLIIIEAFSGFIWAGFNLSTGMFVYHAVSNERLPLCVAYSNVLNSIGVFFGAILGGVLSSLETDIFYVKPIFFVFGLSAFLRLTLMILFVPGIKEVRPVKKFSESSLRKILLRLSPGQMLNHAGIKRVGFSPFGGN